MRKKLLNLWNKFAEVNESGFSRVVTTEEIYNEFLKKSEFASLYWNKEGPTRRNKFRGLPLYNWKFERKGNSRKIISIQSVGFDQNDTDTKFNRPIRKDIREWYFENKKHCALCCESLDWLKKRNKIVIDHKDDSYSDPNVCGKLSVQTQKKEDFQIVCEGCNRRKDLYKQRWPEWRPPPGHYLKIGWGDYFIDENGVKREYWYDGEAYRKYWKQLN